MATPTLPSYPTESPPAARPAAVTLRWIGLLVVLLVLAGGAAGLVVQFFAQERTVTTPVTQPVTRLVARNDTGDVRVRIAGSGVKPQVTQVKHWSFREPVATVDVVDGALQVGATCKGSFWGNCSTDLEVLLPPGTAVEVTSDIGDINASTSAPVDARTDTGDVRLSVTGSPRVSARTNTGDVTVTGGSAGADVRAESDTGGVRLDLLAAPSSVQATTNIGDVTITVPEGDAYHVDAYTDIGQTRVAVPVDSGADRRITARSDTGDVTVRPR